MKVGDLVFDAGLGRYGIIVASRLSDLGYGQSEWEHQVLYEDGFLDTAYRDELKVINERR